MREHKEEQLALNRLVLAVIGGDDREIYMIPELQKMGAYIIGLGLEESPIAGTIECAGSFAEVVQKADALLFPMFGTDERGLVKAKFTRKPIILNEDVLESIPRHLPLFIGWARPGLKAAAQKKGLRIVEVANRDDVAILNSIPSAEGALQMAMESAPVTIHGSENFVLGFGRLGQTMTRVLLALGARVSVAARRDSDLARVQEMGARPLTFPLMEQEISRAQIIFNTVPNKVLPRRVLERVSQDVVIIDLASIPGGTDFEFARTRGIKAQLAPGLPGIVAPKSAGHILARVYPSLLSAYLPGNDGQERGANHEEI